MAFCGFDVIDSKPKGSSYPKDITGVGDHLRAARIDKELLQADLARMLQVSEAAITNWENNLTVPETRYMPSIIKFLGYNPHAFELASLGGKIRNYRYSHGLTHKKMGIMIGVDASTIGSWENKEHRPNKKGLKKLERLLETNA